jgi:class 3 adenylate cyclase/tetratricopeptide (TPR) repeat protein
MAPHKISQVIRVRKGTVSMAKEVAQWLAEIGLGQYAQVFAENDIDFNNVHRLTEDDLKELGLSIGHRRTLQAAIEVRSSEEATVASVPTANPAPAQPATAERRQLTVLFCDLVGSTELSAKLDPEDMREVLRTYQEVCSKVIVRYDGYVAKFMGDGVYAYFGYPTAHEDDAERAINAGLGIVDAVAGIEHDLSVRIGIATGNVAVGDLIGDGASEEANVVGEAPNLAARLQAISEPNLVVIGEATHRLAGGLFDTRELGAHTVKGYSHPVSAWAVNGRASVVSRFRATRGTDLSELVGRLEELEILRRRWQRATQGDGQLVLISGEPGIGKSRLVQALQDEIAQVDLEPVRFQCSPFHTNSALYPAMERLERIAGFEADDTAADKFGKLKDALSRAANLAEDALPLMASLLSIPSGDLYRALDTSPQRQKDLTLDALVEELAGLAMQEPVLFVIEDAHWIDPTTRDLVDMMVNRLPEFPVLMVVTHRPEFDAPWIGRSHVTPIILGRLESRDCAALVKSVTRDADIDDITCERIVEQSDGVPLFAEELTTMVAHSSLAAADGQRDIGSTVSPIDIPSTLHDSLTARLDGLGAARELAQLAACIGRSFSRRLLSAVRESSEADLEDAMVPLLESGLVYPERQRDGSGYAFKHVMVQQAAYAGLLRTNRRKFHERIATALIEQYNHNQSTDMIDIAQHLQAANDIGQALVWFRRAAERARNAGSVRESLEIVNRAFELLEQFHGGKEQRDREELELLVVKLPVITAIEGYASETINLISARALELSVALADRAKESAILYQIATMHEVRGEYSQTQATLARRTQMVEEEKDPEPIVETGELLACSTFYEGRFEKSMEHAQQALQLADPEQPSVLGNTLAEEPTIACLFWMAKSLLVQGWIDQARTRHREALECARRSPHWYARSQAEIDAALLCVFQNDFESALSNAGQAMDSSARVGLAYREAVARLIVEWARAVGDGIAPNEAEMDKSLSVFREVGAMIGYAFYLSLAAQAHATVGNYDRSQEMIDEALKISGRGRGFFYESELYRLNGTLKLQTSGDKAADEAKTLYLNALDIAQAQGARLFALRSANSLARLWADRDQKQRARDVLTPIYSWFTEGSDSPDLKQAKLLLDALG